MEFRKVCSLFLPVYLMVCAPLFATPTPDKGSLAFTYRTGTPPSPQAVTITDGSVITARISTNIDASGNGVSSSADNAGVFVKNVIGNVINVGLDQNVLFALSQKGVATYTGTMRVGAAECGVDCFAITLTLNIGAGNSSISILYGGQDVSGGLTLNAALGTSVNVLLTIGSSTFQNLQVVPNSSGGWLATSPGNISVGPGTSQNVTVTGTAGILTANTYTGSIQFIGAGGVVAANVTVTFNVGLGGGLTLSQSLLTFTYAIGSTSYPAAQTVTISGATVATYSTTTDKDFLVVSLQSGSTFSVSVNVAASSINLTTAQTYTGHVTFTSQDGRNVTLTVMLIVNTGTPILTFTVSTVNGPAPPAQQVTVTGSGPFLAFSTVAWAAVSPTSGTLTSTPQTLTITVNPQGLGANTYTGAVNLQSPSGVLLQAFQLTLQVGSGVVTPVQVVSPTSLTFTPLSGSSSSQTIIVNGDAGSPFTIQVAGSGLSANPTSGTTPAIVTVTANSTATTGTLFVSSSAGAVNVPVTVNVPTGLALVVSPAASLSWIYAGGPLEIRTLQLLSSQSSSGTEIAFSLQAPSFVTVGATSSSTPANLAVAVNTGIVPASTGRREAVSVNLGALSPGFNSGNLVVTASQSLTNSPLNIPITVLVPGTPQGPVFNPSVLALNAVAGGAPITQTVALTGPAGQTFTVSATSPGNFLVVSPSAGTFTAGAATTLTLTINPLTLTAGNTVNGTLTVVTGNGQSQTLTVTVSVTGTPTTTPALALGTNQLTLNYQQGQPAASQTVSVTSSGTAVNFTAVSSDTSVVTVSPGSGLTANTLTITASTGLGQGTYSATVTVSAPGANNSPQTIRVTVNVTSPQAVTVSSSQVNFSARTGGPNPDNQTVQVASTGAPLTFMISTGGVGWLTVTPSSQSTPATLTFSVDPSQVGARTTSTTVTVTASNGTSQSITVTITVTAPLPTIVTVYHGGSMQEATSVAPGEVVVISGDAMGPASMVTRNVVNGVVTASLAGTRVLASGFASAVLSTSANQVIAVIPYAMADGRTNAFIQVEFLGQRSNAVPVQVVLSDPNIFTADLSGTGQASAVNEDGSQNNGDHPAPVATVVTIHITGEGQTVPPGVDGLIASDDPSLAPQPAQQPVSATVDGLPADVSVSGVPGEVAGMSQAKVTIPAGVNPGPVLVVVTVGNASTQDGVTISVAGP